MVKTYQYRPQGVCSNLMEISVEDGVIRDVKIAGGCSGMKATSCPDQLAKALKQVL